MLKHKCANNGLNEVKPSRIWIVDDVSYNPVGVKNDIVEKIRNDKCMPVFPECVFVREFFLCQVARDKEKQWHMEYNNIIDKKTSSFLGYVAETTKAIANDFAQSIQLSLFGIIILFLIGFYHLINLFGKYVK